MPRDEGLITFARIKELEEYPVVGAFDTSHLCEVHRRIFQDLPHHNPGQFRRAAPAWVKSRELESGERYTVPYTPRRVLESGRDQLYRARDVAVMKRAFPGLDELRAMATENRMEYETYWVLQNLQQKAQPLEVLIRASVTLSRFPQQGLERDDEWER